MDLMEAKRLYQLAARQGHQVAQERVREIDRIQSMSAEALCEKANDYASVVTAEPLGYHYYVLAAEKGNPYAMFRLGSMYRCETGVKRDYVEALMNYGRTILTDDKEQASFAYRMIAGMAALGQGIAKDAAQANYYMRKAMELGDDYLKNYNSMTEYLEETKEEEVYSYYTQAKLYQEGYWTEVDINKAYDSYKMALNEGDAEAAFSIAAMFAYGFSTERNINYALDCMKQAQGSQLIHGTWEMVEELLLSYYNLHTFNRYDKFTFVVAEDAVKRAFLVNNQRLAFAYLNVAKAYGWDMEGMIQYFDSTGELRQKWGQEFAKELFEQDGSNMEWEEVIDNKSVSIRTYSTEDEISADAIEMLRVFVKLEEFENLCTLGSDAYYANNDAPQNTRLALTCFKLAAENNCFKAFEYCAAAFLHGDHEFAPVNIALAKRMIERLDGCIEFMKESGTTEEWKNSVILLENTKHFLEYQMQKEANQTIEEMKADEEKYRSWAQQIEEKHYPEEEWLLYELYKMADYKKRQNGAIETGDEIPYEHAKVDWDAIIEKPWEMYLRTDDDIEEERDGNCVEVVHLSEGKDQKDTLPDDLDSYFEGMIGMEPIKEQINKIYRTVKMQIMRDEVLRERGIEPTENEKGYNFILLGNPGTGKTTVARIIAKILYDIKIREKDSFVEVERSGVVGEHVGSTTTRMREILNNVKGGTLFIDEAYALYKEESENDFGREAIDTLMKDMEDNRDSYSVIMAGYKEPMLNMIRHANSGFSSRFSYTIELPDYSEEALVEIADMHIEKQKLIASEGVDEAIIKCIHHDKLDQTFGNARYIRELVNRAVENQSLRLDQMESFEKDDLFELRPEDFWQGTMEEDGVEKYLGELKKLTGLSTLKKDVESLIHTITVQKEMEKRGLQKDDSLGTLHMAFKGNPGTGKTTVARIIGKLYASLGVLKRGDIFVECTRSDLVGEYQGHTAKKVKKVVESAMGGILFIDEAYALVQGENDSFGKEAIDQLVAEMENNRQNLVVILAGYTKDIDEFLKNNQGLRSRVPKDLFFEDYNMEELYEIALSMLKGKNLNPTEDAKQELRARLVVEFMRPDFGNARGVRNIVEKIWRKQNVRIANLLKEWGADITDEMILQVEKEDVM